MNGITDTKFRRWLFNEISLATGIIAIVISVMTWIQSPVRDLELGDVQIKADILELQKGRKEDQTNLSIHLTELQVQLDRVELQQIKLLEGLARLEAVHR